MLSSFIVLILAINCYNKLSSKLHLIFLFLSLSVFFWCFGSAMVFFTNEVGMNILWNKISYIGAAFTPSLWLILVLEYKKRLKWHHVLSLVVLPIIIVIVAFTNDWHGLLWSNIIQVPNQNGLILIYEHGLFFWITIFYSFLVSLAGILILVRMLIDSATNYRPQILLLILSGLMPIIFSSIYITKFIPIFGVDVTSVGVSISGILIAVSIYQFSFLDIIPIAHEILFKNMINGFMVFDVDDKLIEVNPAANIIAINNNQIGKHANEIFCKFKELKNFYNGSQTESEIFLGNPLNRWIQTQITPIYNDNRVYHGRLLIIQNIDKRKKLEKEIRKSLNEKDLMMKEIHHRVKNNLQVISSLLSLQSVYHEDVKTRDVLRESQNRVKSMAMVHEILYTRENLSKIDMKKYIDELILHLYASYGKNHGEIKTLLNIESVQMDINTALPVGLIINELLTNSLKYAFPEGIGELSLKLQLIDHYYYLEIADNGIGLPYNFDILQTKTLGFQLVNRLVKQLKGSLKLNVNEGTKFCVKFPYNINITYIQGYINEYDSN
ncbi:histidine kinase N-terminal 7TM domain-containing protein [Methanobacterium petrolearium]